MNRTSHLSSTLLLTSLLTLHGTLQADTLTTTGHEGSNPARQHVLAWIPRNLAPTAGVAEALAHLHLDRAMRRTEAELCDGAWQLTPRTLKSRPVPVAAPDTLGAGQAWHYRLSQPEFQLENCPNVTTTAFQRSLSRHLPAWMLIQPAYQLSLWQQGEVIALDRIQPMPTWLAGL